MGFTPCAEPCNLFTIFTIILTTVPAPLRADGTLRDVGSVLTSAQQQPAAAAPSPASAAAASLEPPTAQVSPLARASSRELSPERAQPSRAPRPKYDPRSQGLAHRGPASGSAREAAPSLSLGGSYIHSLPSANALSLGGSYNRSPSPEVEDCAAGPSGGATAAAGGGGNHGAAEVVGDRGTAAASSGTHEAVGAMDYRGAVAAGTAGGDGSTREAASENSTSEVAPSVDGAFVVPSALQFRQRRGVPGTGAAATSPVLTIHGINN